MLVANMSYSPPLIELSDAVQLVSKVQPYNLNLSQFNFQSDHHRILAQQYLPVDLKKMAKLLVRGDNNDGLPKYIRKFRVPVTFLFELRSFVYGHKYPPFRFRPNVAKKAIIREKVLRNWFGKPRSRELRYGEKVEPNAFYLYKKLLRKREIRKQKIVKIAAAVCPQLSFLCCTPDAVVTDSEGNRRLVEIKSPFDGQFKAIKDMIKYNEVKDVRNYVLSKDSETYFQVQCCLHVFNITRCDLVYFSSYTDEKTGTKPDIFVINVRKSDTFLETHLQSMYKTYFKYIYPIVSTEILGREGHISREGYNNFYNMY